MPNFLGCHDTQNGDTVGALGLRVESRGGGESRKRKCKKKNLRILEFYRKARPRGELFAAGESCERDHQVSLTSKRFCSHEALPEVCPLGMPVMHWLRTPKS